MFSQSTLNFKKFVNRQVFSGCWNKSIPRTSLLLSNKMKHLFCFSFISGTLNFGNKRRASQTALSREHDCATAVLLQTNIPECRQNHASSITQLERVIHVVNLWRAEQWIGNRHFIFSSPLAMTLHLKCHIRLAWLIKCLLCRLISLGEST